MKKLFLILLSIFLTLQVFLPDSEALTRRRRAGVSGSARSGSSTLVPFWSDGVALGNFDSSANWQELSGIATANKAGNEGYLWIISDSPANMLAAISITNASNQGVWDFQSPPTYVDVEDIETAVIGGVPYIYFLDFGNNGNGVDSRGAGIDMRILRAIEPAITGSNGTILSTDYIKIDAAFPGVNGPTLRDCEASFVDPDTGTLYIIIKRDATPQRVYSLSFANQVAGSTRTLVYEGAMTALPEARTQALTTTPTFAVDAAIHPSGTEILVKNYNNIYRFPRNKATQTIMQALQQPLVDVTGYVGGGTLITGFTRTSHPNAEPQGEGLTYSKDGRDLYSNSEFVSTEGSTAARYPLFKYSRLPKAPTTTIFQDGLTVAGATYTGTRDTTIWSETNPGVNYGTDPSNVLDKAVGVETDQRKELIKFDLTAIPTNAVVTHCQMDRYIIAEGQGVAFYRMLVDFTETTSTWTSLGGVNDDNVSASSVESARAGVNLDTILSTYMRFNMKLSDCQAMVSNPATNFGWLGEGTDITTGDGVQLASRDSVTAANRPKLTVGWYLP